MARQEMSMTEYADRETTFGIVPLLRPNRIYSTLDLLFVLGSFAIASWCYVQGAAVAGLLSLGQSLAVTFGGVLFPLFLICLIGVMSNRYGIDHWFCMRATWGFWGIAFLLLLATVASSSGFLAINADLYANSISRTLVAAGWDAAGSKWAVRLIAATCPILGFFIALRGVHAIKWATRIMATTLLLVGLIILILIFTQGDVSAMWNAEPLYGMGPADQTTYMLGAEWTVAFVFAWFAGIGVYTRLAKNERGAAWGIWGGYGIIMGIFIFIGAAAAYAAVSEGAAPTGDPTEYLLALGGPGLGTVALLLVAIANISTSAVALYGLTLSTKLLWPSLRYEWLAIAYTVYWVGLVLWGGVPEYYGTFLAVVGVINAPGVSLLVVDYWILRRQKLDLKACFDFRRPAYRYTGGINLVAVAAFAAGAAAYFLVYDPIDYVPRATSVFNIFTASGFAAIVSVAVYLGLALVPPIRRYMLRDRATEADRRELC